MEITLKLETLNEVVGVLSQLPYAQVVGIMAKLQAEVQPQMAAQKSEDAGSQV